MRLRTLPSQSNTTFATVLILAACLAACPLSFAQDDAAAKPAAKESNASEKSDSKSIGYFLGLSMGQQMAQSGIKLDDFDQESLNKGFVDGMNKKDSTISDELLLDTQKSITELLKVRRAEMIAKMKAEGTAYLAANAKKEGVETLDSGMQYKVIKEGDGEAPTPTDTVKVHYTGKLINGKTFDSSVKRGEPATFRVDQVIKGWQEGLQEMKVGSKWMLYIPSDLGYGASGSPPVIGPHQVLVFEVELLEIK